MKHVKALFISDVHIGIKYSQQKKLLEFLQRIEFDALYIVGDFLDGWRLKRRWRWDLTDNQIVRLLLKRMEHGARIYYAIGNHDEFWYDFLQDGEIRFGDLVIRDHFYFHERGKKYMVLHGHQFDFFTRHASWAFALGDMGYNLLMKLNYWIFKFQRLFGMSRWSLSRFAKSRVKEAISKSHQIALKKYATSKGCDGVIYGHTHLPDLHEDEDGFSFMNCGDWVEDTTALLLDENGVFSMVDLIADGESWEDPYTGEVIHADPVPEPKRAGAMNAVARSILGRRAV